MGELTRFGVSIDNGLLEKFDQVISQKGYTNRSEALRDLVKVALMEDSYEEGKREVAGTITLIYSYGFRFKSLQTDPHPSLFILANLQVHLDKHTCMKVLIVRGKANYVSDWANRLLGMKGVVGQFTLSATEDIEGVWCE